MEAGNLKVHKRMYGGIVVVVVVGDSWICMKWRLEVTHFDSKGVVRNFSYFLSYSFSDLNRRFVNVDAFDDQHMMRVVATIGSPQISPRDLGGVSFPNT